jgi:hypothetical protein
LRQRHYAEDDPQPDLEVKYHHAGASHCPLCHGVETKTTSSPKSINGIKVRAHKCLMCGGTFKSVEQT